MQKKLGIESNKEIEKVGIEKFIEECYAYTKSTSAEWEWYVDHIGRWVDFKNSYKTMDQNYMESVLWVFKQLYDKNLVYEGKRVSLYSTKLSTPISNFEVAMDNSYEEVNDPAITVKFPLRNHPFGNENLYALAWTTTPWTMPANMALAINKSLNYVLVRSENNAYIVAENRVESTFRDKIIDSVQPISAEHLVGVSYVPPYDYYLGKIDENVNYKVHHADFITDTDGTGIGHQAPEFGDVDFELAKEAGLYITEALDEAGKYTSQIANLEGMFYRDANDLIMKELAEKRILFRKE